MGRLRADDIIAILFLLAMAYIMQMRIFGDA